MCVFKLVHGLGFERRVKTGDFEHKQASITVHFGLDPREGNDIADRLMATAGTLAFGHVHQLLGYAPTGNADQAAPQTPAAGIGG
jgi:hypothetical protein